MKYGYLNNFKLYTIQDLQSILKISRSFAYRLMHSRELKCVHIHRLLRIPPWELDAYMDSLTEKEKQVQIDTVKSYFCDSIQYYTIKEVQEILQISESLTRQLLRNNELKGKRICHETRISSDSLFQFITTNEK